jgi:2-C-methyl-D-erythritol 4-phosphate cytidylyltransferase
MNAALIFAGGVGQRMNCKSLPDIPKQFLEYEGKAIIIHTIRHFEEHPEIDGIVVVSLDSWMDRLACMLEREGIRKIAGVVAGGATGQESIRKGLEALRLHYAEDTFVLIHDGVRPLINRQLISDNIASARRYGNAVTVVPATETLAIKPANEDAGTLGELIDRSRCVVARAPQTFRLKDLLDAHEKVQAENIGQFIDTVSLMRHFGYDVYPVSGPMENIKITTPSDYYMFCALMQAQANE